MLQDQQSITTEGPIRIGHASGTILVDATVTDGKALNGAVFRSARRLFEGNVLYRISESKE